MSAPCSVLDCCREIHAKGYCYKHWERFRRNGTPDSKLRPAGAGTIQRGHLVKTVNGKKRFEHDLIAERVLGKPLPSGAIVHHADGNGLNNENDNLVICPSRGYHHLLHQRMRALAACGNANWRKCSICKRYDDPLLLEVFSNRAHHKSCESSYNAKMHLARRARRGPPSIEACP